MKARAASLGALPRRALGLARLGLGASGVTRERPLGGPVYAQIGLSDACNHRCTMCGYHPPTEPSAPLGQFGFTKPGLLPLATFERVVDDLASLGTQQLDLVGRGEPLLHPDAVRAVRHAKSRGLVVTLTTNGSRLDAAIAEGLVDAGLDRLRVSLNAGRAETYPRIHANQDAAEFGRVVANARRLAELRRARRSPPHVALAFAIGATNFRELVDMVERAAEVGADAAHFQHAVHMSYTPDLALDDDAWRELVEARVPEAVRRARALGVETDLPALAASPPAYRAARTKGKSAIVPCYVGHFFTLVLGNGNVMACCQTQEALGDVGVESFRSIWSGPRYRRMRALARKLPATASELSAYECDRCFFRPHNLTVHKFLHPLSRSAWTNDERTMPLAEYARLSRLERSHDDD